MMQKQNEQTDAGLTTQDTSSALTDSISAFGSIIESGDSTHPASPVASSTPQAALNAAGMLKQSFAQQQQQMAQATAQAQQRGQGEGDTPEIQQGIKIGQNAYKTGSQISDIISDPKYAAQKAYGQLHDIMSQLGLTNTPTANPMSVNDQVVDPMSLTPKVEVQPGALDTSAMDTIKAAETAPITAVPTTPDLPQGGVAGLPSIPGPAKDADIFAGTVDQANSLVSGDVGDLLLRETYNEQMGPSVGGASPPPSTTGSAAELSPSSSSPDVIQPIDLTEGPDITSPAEMTVAPADTFASSAPVDVVSPAITASPEVAADAATTDSAVSGIMASSDAATAGGTSALDAAAAAVADSTPAEVVSAGAESAAAAAGDVAAGGVTEAAIGGGAEAAGAAGAAAATSGISAAAGGAVTAGAGEVAAGTAAAGATEAVAGSAAAAGTAAADTGVGAAIEDAIGAVIAFLCAL